ncbi:MULTISPECIES: kelch repeat-containing protein [Myxococcaceae]|uniref:kelch repeat-containing protein n=1 Tax=Myxococcaceae TaxID=31 RepID=UPI001890879E|nr:MULTISPECIES: kelch repeat-containing protein [Myxococcaceae]MBF5042612.1 hypothetical protein [Simulacricoccus sp. 17bor-14]
MWPASVRLRLLAAALVLTLPAGCSLFESEGTRLPLQLVTRACAGTPPLEGATHLRLRVTGEGMAPLERLVPVGSPPEALEGVPPGPARVLEVRAYQNRPEEGGRVVALGRTAPFDVAGGAAPSQRVVVRRVNAFTPVSDVEHPETCGALAAPRAGHSATLLQDGRVLVAGGFALQAGARVALSSAELYAPDTGTLSAAPDLGSARAFHSASLLPSGSVLLAGGENAAGPLADALRVDLAQGGVASFPLERARSQHAAAVDSAGHVLLAGGVGEGGGVVAPAEARVQDGAAAAPVAVPLPRLGASALRTPGDGLAVVGGSDGSALVQDVVLLRFGAAGFESAGPPARLLQGRRAAAVAPWAGGASALVLGGFDTPTESPTTQRALATSELVALTPGARATPGPNVGARADACAVALPDGRVLAAGGRTGEPGTLPQSSDAAELIVPPAADASTPLPVVLGLARLEAGRWAHTCTLLADGTVLVVGGLKEAPGEVGVVREVLGDVLVFTPAPVD